MSENRDEPFEGWAKLELLGHRVIYGRVSEQNIAGKGFIRVDVPEMNNGGDLTQFYSPEAVYGLSPLTEELCRKLVGTGSFRPVSPYDLPVETARRLTKHEADFLEGDDDDDEDDF